MSNYDSLSLYLICEGSVERVEAPVEFDGTDSVLVAAVTPESALGLAAAYDRGEIDIDNLSWCGQTIAVLSMVDADTGLYA